MKKIELKEAQNTQYEGKGKYSYQSIDGSFGDLYIANPLAKKLLTVLPWWIPANIITIISNSMVLIATVISLTANRINWPVWIFIPILYFIYLVGDAADGMQARRTKTGSPLGEFTDHFLDTFVTGLVLLSLFFVYRVGQPYFVSICLLLGYMMQLTAFWERYKTGHISFGKFSATDAVLFLSFFIAAGFIKPVNDFFTQPIANLIPALSWLKLSVVESGIAICAFASIFVSIATIVRAGGCSWRFLLYILESIVLSLVAATLEQEDLFIVMLTLIFFHANYSASLLSAIVMKEKDPFPDILLTIAMCVTLALNIHTPILYTTYFSYIVISVTIRVSRFFKKNEEYWVWRNPELPDTTSENK